MASPQQLCSDAPLLSARLGRGYFKENPVKRRARQKPEWAPVKTKRPVYLRATSLPECRSRAVVKAVPEFHLPSQVAELENANRRTVGKRDRGAWHLGR